MQNKIYYGDNLEVLRRYIQDESIDLCYIDPPFNSKRNYNQIYNNVGNEDKAQTQAFIDTWTWDDIANQGLAAIYSNYNGAFTVQSIDLIAGLEKVLKKGSLLAYLISITLRIVEIHRVLKPTGSFYLHCDPTASHYLKLVLDAIFCARGGDFINEIIWQRTNNPKGSQFKSKKFGIYTDTILFYAKSNHYIFEIDNAKIALTEQEVEKKYHKIDIKGRFYEGPILRSASMGERLNLVFTYKNFTPEKWGWRMTKENIQKLDEAGDLGWSRTGKPFRKLRPEKNKGFPISNLWIDIDRLYNSIQKLEYPTQKPEALLERIIKASSNEGDTVLDAYCGCGTTVAVAERLKRHWIGIDITYQSISLILKRLTEQSNTALANIEINGVPKDFASAVALAHKQDDRLRKEFEKWLVLTYSRNQAIINDKKGGDGGIDGIAFILHNRDNETRKILFSVKSSKTLTTAVIRELNGTVERENAACGILLTLYPMPNLLKESKQYGNYHNELVNRDFPKIQVINVEDVFNGKLIDMPHIREVLKATASKSSAAQDELL